MMAAAGEKLYLNEEQKDIVFFVGVDKMHCVRFPAHKLILSSSSEVFSTMLAYERFKEGETGEITVSDVTPAAFRSLLQFVYTGRIDIPSVSTCRDILYAADKYLMPKLTRLCLAHLENIDVNLDNFWNFFTIICSFYSESLSPKTVTKTLEYLDENADVVLSNDEFKNLTFDEMSKIVKRCSLKNVTESKILESLFQWSQMECCRKNCDINAENERKIVWDAKYDIRYLLIPRDKLMDDTMNYTFLTQDEKTMFLDNSLNACATLPPPWNNYLLKEPRSKNSTIALNLDSENVTDVDMATIPTSSLLLVVSSECILKELEITVLSESGIIKVNGDITDLEGNIFLNWNLPSKACKENVLKVDVEMCLEKFKAYKINFVCIKGQLVTEYKSSGYCNDDAGRISLFLVDFPTSDLVVDKFKSTDLLSKVIAHENRVLEFYESARNSIVKSVTLTI